MRDTDTSIGIAFEITLLKGTLNNTNHCAFLFMRDCPGFLT